MKRQNNSILCKISN